MSREGGKMLSIDFFVMVAAPIMAIVVLLSALKERTENND